MYRKIYEFEVAAPIEKVWQFHSSAASLQVLTPPGRDLQELSEDLAVKEGAVHRMRVRQFGIPVVWEAKLSEVHPPFEFTDTAIRSPFNFWKHHHEFIATQDGTLVRDTIEYWPPFGVFGGLANLIFISRVLDALWRYRIQATKKALETDQSP